MTLLGWLVWIDAGVMVPLGAGAASQFARLSGSRVSHHYCPWCRTSWTAPSRISCCPECRP